MDLAYLTIFLLATLALNLTPGPDMLYVFARSVGQGRRAGVVSAFGIGAGTLVHMMAVALGLSTLLLQVPIAYDAIRYLGAAYLLYLGVRSILSAGDLTAEARPTQDSLPRIFRQGVITNVLNPKVALFFLAFLPQFTSRGAGSEQLRNEMLLLGAGAMIIGLSLDLCYAVGADAIGRRVRSTRTTSRWRNRLVGGVYLGLAAFAVISTF
jgi:threonine/homoserine/homoserine lactone efflux protein